MNKPDNASVPGRAQLIDLKGNLLFAEFHNYTYLALGSYYPTQSAAELLVATRAMRVTPVTSLLPPVS